jgi:putative phosphoesterase
MMPSSTQRVQDRQAACSSLSWRVMLRLGLIGDTQGRYRVERLLRFVGDRFAGVDEIWHVGDWQEEAVLDGLKALGKPLTVVNGNAPDDPRYPMMVRRRLEGLEVGMVHRPPRKGDPWAAELDICIHGHTHRWRDERVGRTRFVNVSTPTAAGLTRERTMGILSLDGGLAELERIDVELPR